MNKCKCFNTCLCIVGIVGIVLCGLTSIAFILLNKGKIDLMNIVLIEQIIIVIICCILIFIFCKIFQLKNNDLNLKLEEINNNINKKFDKLSETIAKCIDNDSILYHLVCSYYNGNGDINKLKRIKHVIDFLNESEDDKATNNKAACFKKVIGSSFIGNKVLGMGIGTILGTGIGAILRKARENY